MYLSLLILNGNKLECLFYKWLVWRVFVKQIFRLYYTEDTLSYYTMKETEINHSS